MAQLTNKVAIVTGGSSGIGQAVAKRLAAEGANVFFNYNNYEDGAKATLAAIQQAGGEAAYAQLDLRRTGTIDAFFDAAVAKYGRPDIAVLNAGAGTLKPILESTEDDFDQFFGLNSKGTYFCLKAAGRLLNDNGSIVMTSSSTTAFPTSGVSIYAGSKAAIRIFAAVAADEFGQRGITVNAVMPGVTLTRMAEPLPQSFKDEVASTSPFQRLGKAEDVANYIYTLVSPDGHWATGQTLLANGGGTH